MESEEAIKEMKIEIEKFENDLKALEKTDIDVEYKIQIVTELTEYILARQRILNHVSKQDKMIELMLEYLEDELTDDICNKENCYADEYINGHCQKCLNCIKQYFEKKAEEAK